MSETRWDPEQYDRFKRERAQPFHDLIARIPAIDAATIADLGCGDGTLTRTLLDRWLDARVWGVDLSGEMLARAAKISDPRLTFVKGDLFEWRPPAPLDLLVSNAALHWVPDHAIVLRRLCRLLSSSGTLAVQMPNNRNEAAYRIVEELLVEPRWQERAKGAFPSLSVEPASFYEATLASIGFHADVWQTVYEHRMPSADEIVEWLKGAMLRPVLTVFSPADAEEFVGTVRERVREAYPARPDGVVFPFRRLFFVARAGLE